MKNQAFRAAFPHTLPVMAGYVFLGFAFGLLMITQGAPLWIPILMSVAIYSGALEFAAVPFFFAAPDYPGSFFIGLMLSIRHVFYGIPMLKKYAGAGKRKLPMIFCLTDETFSIASAVDPPEAVDPTDFYAWISFLNYAYWIGGTALGALFGRFIPVDLAGLDFALTALFLVLFLEQFHGREGRFGGLCGLCAALLALLLFGSGRMVPAAMVLILIALLTGRRRVDSE